MTAPVKCEEKGVISQRPKDPSGSVLKDRIVFNPDGVE